MFGGYELILQTVSLLHGHIYDPLDPGSDKDLSRTAASKDIGFLGTPEDTVKLFGEFITLDINGIQDLRNSTFWLFN